MVGSWGVFLEFTYNKVSFIVFGKISEIIGAEEADDVIHVRFGERIIYNGEELKVGKSSTMLLSRDAIFKTKKEAAEVLISSLFEGKER